MSEGGISIIKISCGTAFYGNTDEPQHIRKKCDCCGDVIYYQYIYIINKLKEAGLLDKDYLLLCCTCYQEKKDHA